MISSSSDRNLHHADRHSYHGSGLGTCHHDIHHCLLHLDPDPGNHYNILGYPGILADNLVGPDIDQEPDARGIVGTFRHEEVQGALGNSHQPLEQEEPTQRASEGYRLEAHA